MRFEKKYFIANWKLNKTLTESIKFCEQIIDVVHHSHVMIAPSFCNLSLLIERFKNLKFGAQSVSRYSHGAYTGEVSAKMLQDIQANFCLIGHSERRQHFHETNESVAFQLKEAIDAHLLPVLCIGESLEAKNLGLTKQVLKEQLIEGLKFGLDQAFELFIAYEPIWAIGTSLAATAEMTDEILEWIKKTVFQINPKISLKLLYGGSVNLDNIDSYLEKKHIDGVLVGGASLDLQTFKKFITG
jgi:triosephosphate isomerase